MSHTSRLTGIKINSVQALYAAAKGLRERGVNCEILQNAQPRMYFRDQHGKCDYVLYLKNGRYDVGFQKEDNSYTPVLDHYQNHVSNQIGAHCPMPNTREGKEQHTIGMFYQEYAKAAAIESAELQGYSVEECFLDNEENIQLTIAA